MTSAKIRLLDKLIFITNFVSGKMERYFPLVIASLGHSHANQNWVTDREG